MSRIMNYLMKVFILIVWLLLGFKLFIPAQPFLCKVYSHFVNFPKLKDAVVYEGTVYVEGEEKCRRGSCIPPTYYVVNSSGKHEIYWGLPGDRYERFPKSSIQGATGKFWFHPIYGSLQENFTIHKNEFNNPDSWEGQSFFHGIEESKSLFEEHFKYREHITMAIPFFIFLIFFYRAMKKLFLTTKSTSEG